jgi:hypothetical protein
MTAPMKRFALLLALAMAFARCATAPPPPAPVPAPAPAPEPAPAPALPSIGMLKVTASSANIRRDANTTSDVIVQVKRGEHLALLAKSGDWMNVRLTTGETGWVSSKLVANDVPKPVRKARNADGCAGDSDYRFITAPKPAFSDSEKHGVVTVEANVSAAGVVMSTRVVSNTTGDQSLAFLTEREIKSARFAAPVRSCVARAFIFTYTRAF